MAKEKLLKLVLPPSTARFPWLSAPDTKFDSDGVFKTDQVIPSDEPIIAKIQELAEKALEEAKEELIAKGGKGAAQAKKLQLHVPFEDDYDDSGDETGNVIVKVKSKASGTTKKGEKWERKIPIFDASGKHLKNPPAIYGGSVLAVEVEVNPFAMPATNKAGVTLRISAVQIHELASGSGGGSASSHGFGVVDGGYVAEEDEAPQSSFSEPAEEQFDDSDDF